MTVRNAQFERVRYNVLLEALSDAEFIALQGSLNERRYGRKFFSMSVAHRNPTT